jgi:four helix bundle protein
MPKRRQTSTAQGYRKVRIYQRAVELADMVTETFRETPAGIDGAGLVSEARQVATSIPPKIADAWSHRKDDPELMIRYLALAQSRAAEMIVYTDLAFRLGHLPIEAAQTFLDAFQDLTLRLTNLLAKQEEKHGCGECGDECEHHCENEEDE